MGQRFCSCSRHIWLMQSERLLEVTGRAWNCSRQGLEGPAVVATQNGAPSSRPPGTHRHSALLCRALQVDPGSAGSLLWRGQ